MLTCVLITVSSIDTTGLSMTLLTIFSYWGCTCCLFSLYRCFFAVFCLCGVLRVRLTSRQSHTPALALSNVYTIGYHQTDNFRQQYCGQLSVPLDPRNATCNVLPMIYLNGCETDSHSATCKTNLNWYTFQVSNVDEGSRGVDAVIPIVESSHVRITFAFA